MSAGRGYVSSLEGKKMIKGTVVVNKAYIDSFLVGIALGKNMKPQDSHFRCSLTPTKWGDPPSMYSTKSMLDPNPR